MEVKLEKLAALLTGLPAAAHWWDETTRITAVAESLRELEAGYNELLSMIGVQNNV